MTLTGKLVAAVVGGLTLAAAAGPAFADHWRGHRYNPYWDRPRIWYPPPPRVVYRPAPPVYYYPPPAYVYRPAPRTGFGIWFSG